MMKRLTAFTLAMLMLLNPMTAFAVSWDDLMQGLTNSGTNSYTEDGVEASFEDDALTVTGNSGLITDLWLNDYYSSYTFGGTLEIGGEYFDIYVYDNKSVAVNIGENVNITTEYGVYAAVDGSSLTINNAGTIDEDLYIETYSDNTIVVNNSGYIGENLDLNIYGDNNVANITNTGIIDDDLDLYVQYGSNNSIVANNTGTIDEDLEVYIGHDELDPAYSQNNSIIVNSRGDIGDDLEAYVFGEDSCIIVNSSGDIDEDLESQALGEGSSVIVNHDGNVGNQVLSGALFGGQSSVIVTGTADSAIVGGVDGKEATLGVLGGLNNGNPFIVDGENVGKVTLLIAAGNGAVVDPSVVEEIYKKSVLIYEGEEYSGQPDALEIITTDDQGNKTARYSVAPDGTVKLEEVYPQDSGSSYDDPATWTAERKRHDKEEERKAAAIGGVTGSPYWIKQLYLGYMSLDLRLFDGEEQLLFKEYLSWQPDGSKLLTLRTKITDTSDLMMRLDGMVIKKLQQAGISTIAIVDGNGNPFMAYEVADLEGARTMYKLGLEDYIVVGEATDDVMMIGADGQIVPIEGEKAEETPAA